MYTVTPVPSHSITAQLYGITATTEWCCVHKGGTCTFNMKPKDNGYNQTRALLTGYPLH